MAPARVVRPQLRRDALLDARADGTGELTRPGGPAVTLSAVECALVQRFDGRRGEAELLAALPGSSAAAPEPLYDQPYDQSYAQLHALLARLADAGLLEGDGPVGAQTPGAAEGPVPQGAEPASLADEATLATDGQAPGRLSAEPTALSDEADPNPTTTGARSTPLYDPALFSTNLTAVGVALDPGELGRLMADALAALRRGEVEVAQDMLRNAASLAPGDGKVRAVLDAVAPLREGAAAKEIDAAWAACTGLAPSWVAAALGARAETLPANAPQRRTPSFARGGPGGAFAARRADGADGADGRHLAVSSRVPFRAIAAVMLVVCAAAGAGMWWAASAPELPQVRLRGLEPVRHPLYEGGPASAVRQHRSIWVNVPASGEVSSLAALRGPVAAGAEVVRVTPAGAQRAAVPTALPAAAAAAPEALRRRVAALQNRVQQLERRAVDARAVRGAPRRRQATAARARALAAARAQLEAAKVAAARAQASDAPPPQGTETAELVARAPFAGTVAELRVGVGQQVRRGAPAALLVDRSVVHLRFVVPAAVPHAVGERLTVAVDVAAPPERQGRIVEVRAVGNKRELDVELPDPQASLPLVLSSSSFRVLRETQTACFVGKEAISCAGRSCTLWQLVDGHAQPRRVRALEMLADGVWVAWEPAASGKEAPLIVSSPQLQLTQLRPGMALQPL